MKISPKRIIAGAAFALCASACTPSSPRGEELLPIVRLPDVFKSSQVVKKSYPFYPEDTLAIARTPGGGQELKVTLGQQHMFLFASNGQDIEGGALTFKLDSNDRWKRTKSTAADGTQIWNLELYIAPGPSVAPTKGNYCGPEETTKTFTQLPPAQPSTVPTQMQIRILN